VVLYCSSSQVSQKCCNPPYMRPYSPSLSSSKTNSRHGIGVEHTLRTEELSGDVQGLATHNNDLLAVEQLLSHSAGQPTKEVTLAIDRDLSDTLQLASDSPVPRPPRAQRPAEKNSFHEVELKGARKFLAGGRERLTTCSKVDIFALLHGYEQTNVEGVVGILNLRDGEEWCRFCRWGSFLESAFQIARQSSVSLRRRASLSRARDWAHTG